MTPAPSPTLVNGKPAQSVAATERALQYGDGLFETISCVAGVPRWLGRHLQRLRAGCERLRIAFTEQEALGAEVAALARSEPRCIVKVIISRGETTRRGYRPQGDERVTRIVSRHEWPEDGAVHRDLRVGLSEVRLGINPLLAGLKHLNRLEQVLAQLHRPVELDEVLMCASDGELVGGSMSNVFLVDERGLFTPPLERCGVAGVMRARVVDAVGASTGRNVAGPLQIRSLTADRLGSVREAFVTNVRWGIRSIAVLDGRALASDDYAQRLRRLTDAAYG